MRWFLDIFRNLRLVWRLIWDHRVPLLLKIAVIFSLGYLAWPFDLLKDFGVPFIGRVDDVIVLALASIIFVRLSPPQIVREHREAIWGKSFSEGGKVTEADYEVLDGDKSQNARGDSPKNEDRSV